MLPGRKPRIAEVEPFTHIEPSLQPFPNVGSSSSRTLATRLAHRLHVRS
jgi:hypothetical protein